MKLSSEMDKLVSSIRLRLCARSPFFGSLVFFARIEASGHIARAATDGRDIFVNPSYFRELSQVEQEVVIIHEVLHAALLHVPRRAARNGDRWNIAADIVVNGMLANEGYTLLKDSIRETELEHYSTEEVYDLLQLRNPQPSPPGPDGTDLLNQRPGDCALPIGARQLQTDPLLAPEKYWSDALEQARIRAEASVAGNLPTNFKRELSRLDAAQLDWRHYLWRYLVHTPVDFEGFDRRFVGQGIYLDALAGETVQVAVAVDTSASIHQEQLQSFLGEVQGILQAYPHLRCDLYYADAEVQGPFQLSAITPIPPPIGGGGTDFRPFFKRIATEYDQPTATISVYLTDGYGRFPESPPPFPVLWVVTPGSRDLDQFPFGEAVRLVDEM